MIRVRASHQTHRTWLGIDKIVEEHEDALRDAMYSIGRRNQLDMRKNIKMGRKSGRQYKIGRRVHTASAPGEAPAMITGKLMRSCDYDVSGTSNVKFGYADGDGTDGYGLYLEKGTEKDGSVHIKPRPNLFKVADDNAQTFINYMAREFKK